jgi:hypothetical protein
MRRDLAMADLGDLLDLRLLAVLATYWRDGTVLLSPVWHEWRAGSFNVVTGSNDVKAAHLRATREPASWSASTSRPTAESRCAATPGSPLKVASMR